MRVLNPEMANWLLALPVAFGLWFLFVRAKSRFRRRAGIGAVLARRSRLSGRARERLALAIAVVAITAIVVALMRPQLLLERRTPEYEREDLVIILDRSASMKAEDIHPSRFTRAVAEIKAFLNHKPDAIDRVGLVGFAGSSLILSYLTRDVDSIFFYLDWIEEDTEDRFGTDMGSAIESARELAHRDTSGTRKVFLLVSDGEDQEHKLDRQLAAVRDEGIRIYPIGVGSENDVAIPAASRAGTYLKDDRGATLTTRFEEMTLRNIANVTGGRYFRSVSGQELAPALQDIARQERRLVGWKTTVAYRDLYPAALAVAAVATLAVLLTL